MLESRDCNYRIVFVFDTQSYSYARTTCRLCYPGTTAGCLKSMAIFQCRTISAPQFVEVRARVEGFLEQMLFEEGTQVNVTKRFSLLTKTNIGKVV